MSALALHPAHQPVIIPVALTAVKQQMLQQVRQTGNRHSAFFFEVAADGLADGVARLQEMLQAPRLLRDGPGWWHSRFRPGAAPSPSAGHHPGSAHRRKTADDGLGAAPGRKRECHHPGPPQRVLFRGRRRWSG
jgi:hypothetical protein